MKVKKNCRTCGEAVALGKGAWCLSMTLYVTQKELSSECSLWLPPRSNEQVKEK